MANKFNTDFLKSTQSSQTGDITSKFKSTAEIFDKANSMIDSISVEKLRPYSNHPFKIREGERLSELTQSILDQGILVPLIVRCHTDIRGSYEILAGHHRFEAAKRAGLTDVPCIIKDVDDNTSALIVVESNKQRGFSDMLPSEIARALKLEYDALKCQGKRTDILAELEEIMSGNYTEKSPSNPDETEVYGTCYPVGQKLESRDKVAEKSNMSTTSIHRYIRLNNLIEPLLEMVDEASIAIRPAVDLSYLTASEQQDVVDVIDDYTYKVDMKKSEKLKEYSQASKLNTDTAKLILSGTIFEAKIKKLNSIKLPYKKIKEFVDTSLSPTELEGYVVRALEFYKINGGELD